MSLEVWGGVECTVARMGDNWRDQSAETGHSHRLADLDAIAALGIRKLRYPVLWETISPENPDICRWDWHDQRLGKLRELGVAPIAGLIHHGSGPHYTSLLDPRFPERLARHAARVAERYPWVTSFTPVNEPLTTARFSGLYGHWYPHGRDERVFLRALINQCKAVVLSMQAIRHVTPHAELVQTDDLGKTFSTPLLSYQAQFENERRWLTYDLLHGRVDRKHPMFGLLTENGIEEREIFFFQDNLTAPDIIGVNHYLTSERHLDENLDSYPGCFRGGNGRHAYADVEAVRMHEHVGDVGPLARLREVWERYRRPVAVTEVHHGCTRDEQMRWLHEVWSAARTLRGEGADIRAVTVWALLGAVDWNTLLVGHDGFYEPGAFDVRGTALRTTGVGKLAQALATSGKADHPAMDAPGWWRRDARFYRPVEVTPQIAETPAGGRRLVITGATGTLGRAFSRICTERGIAHVLLGRRDMDIADADQVARTIDNTGPWAVINTAGYVKAAEADREAERCFRENTTGAATVAAICAAHGIPLMTFSSDLVFDGTSGRPYVESDLPAPRCTYGRSKAMAEAEVQRVNPLSLIVRTSAFFSPWDQYNFVHAALSQLEQGRRFQACASTIVSPTYVPDLVHAALDLLFDGETGIWHLANDGAVSWFELARSAARAAGLPADLVMPERRGPAVATPLISERGRLLPSLEASLSRYARDCGGRWAVQQAAE